MRDDSEINEAATRAADAQVNAALRGSKFGGMTYEDGLREAFDWVTEEIEEDPTLEFEE